MKKLRAGFVGMLSAALCLVPMSLQAGMVDSATLMQVQQQADARAEVTAFMARDQVREQLQAWGVSEEQVEARLAGLTDAEVQELAANINELPAGAGVIGVIGVVFVVLMVLELVGVTDIFKSF